MTTATSFDDALDQAQQAFHQGQFYEASVLFQQIVDDLPEASDGSDVQLSALRGKAVALYRLGRFHEAELLLRQVLIACGTEPEGERCVDGLGRLAEAIGEQGRWVEAEALAREAVRRGKSELGRRHEATLTARLALAWVCSHTAPATSEAWIRETRDAIERNLGESHPVTWSAQHLLVDTLRTLGRWDEAEQAAQDLIAVGERHQGAGHPYTLRARCDLALILHGAGSQAQAVALADDVLADCERALDRSHPDAVRIRRNYKAITEG
ncbi:tetratricopeptide repeat protein [Streptomyces sp. NPDC101455]|uniref:tetratricopeptide repeat protein n=1 Tax=Streptomyces sp. NPDC101455 TaxID=3366142 RepID=UPI003804D1C8